MSTNTTHYSLIKPSVGDPTDEDLWGGYLNDDLDDIDSLLWTATNWVKRDVSSTGNVTTADRNKLILADATGGAVTLTLPAAASAADGFCVAVKRTNSGANAVIIDGNASETIDGAATLTLSGQYDGVILQCSGAAWNIMARNQADAVTLTGTQTLTNKTLTSPSLTTPAFTGTPTGTVTSGTYTPTITATLNVGTVSIQDAQYTRIGDIVTVSGQASIDPITATSSGTQSGVEISLPIASTFSDSSQLAGTAAPVGSTSDGLQNGNLRASTISNKAILVFLATNNAARNWSYIFMYRII